jgi:phage tail sheath gpL-like
VSISFNQIPGNLKVPLFYAEIGPSDTSYTDDVRLLVIGNKTADGSATLNQPVITSGSNLDALFGPGSNLSEMVSVARKNAPFSEIWALPVAEPTGVACVGTITVEEVATAPSTLTFYVNGYRVDLVVNPAQTKPQIATAIAAEITADPSLPVIAAVGGVGEEDTVVLTAKLKGTANTIIFNAKLYDDESDVSSTMLSYLQTTAATGEIDMSAALAYLGDEEYETITAPVVTSTGLDAVKSFLASRWHPMEMLYGHFVTAKDANLAAQITTGRNDPHTSIVAVQSAPQSAYIWAAAMAAKANLHLTSTVGAEASRPLHTLPLEGVIAPRVIADRWSTTERQSLYVAGMSGWKADRSGVVRIDRVRTTRTRNDAGLLDESWSDINTMYQNMIFARRMRAAVVADHGRKALADDNPFAIQGIATPRDIRNTIVSAYLQLVQEGLVENIQGFESALIVEREPTDATRVNAYLPADFVNQLNVVATRIVSFLQLPN